MLTWQRQIAADPHRIFRATQRQDETRQQFVNYHIQQFQRQATGPLHFGVMLQFFRELGEMYDRGSRLRDSQAGAA